MIKQLSKLRVQRKPASILALTKTVLSIYLFKYIYIYRSIYICVHIFTSSTSPTLRL